MIFRDNYLYGILFWPAWICELGTLLTSLYEGWKCRFNRVEPKSCPIRDQKSPNFLSPLGMKIDQDKKETFFFSPRFSDFLIRKDPQLWKVNPKNNFSSWASSLRLES